MSGGGRPRGWFDDVPLIGADKSGSGDGSASSIDYFADVPTIGGTPDAGSPPSRPSSPVPTTLRDRAARALEPETTPIPPDRQAEFEDWVDRNKITDLDQPDSHYDYRGAFLAGVGGRSGNGHWPDTFKQHGHPTFSDESQYSRGFDDGGHWRGDTYEPQPSTSSPLAPDRAADEPLPAGVDYARPYPKQIQDVATPGPEGEFVLGAASEAAKLLTTAPLEMTRGAVSTVFGNPTAEELANPLVRASITNRMGTAGGDKLLVDQLQPAAPDQPGPLELAGEQAKGFVTYPFHGAKELFTNPDPYEKGKGAAAVVAGLLGLKEMAHGGLARIRELKTKPGGPIPGEPPVDEGPTPSEPPIDATRPPPAPEPTVTPPPPARIGPPKAEPAGIFDDVPVVPPEPPAAGPPGPPQPPAPGTAPTVTDAERSLQRAREREAEGNNPPGEQLQGDELRRQQLQGAIGASEFGIRANEIKLADGNRMGGRPYTEKEIEKIKAELEGHRSNLARYKAELAGIGKPPAAEPTGDLSREMETEAEPVPPNLEIHPQSRAAEQGETDPEALYRGSRQQARAHALRSLNAQIKLEDGKNEKGRPWSEKEKKFLEHEQSDGMRLSRATIEEIGQTFGPHIAEHLTNELVTEMRDVYKRARQPEPRPTESSTKKGVLRIRPHEYRGESGFLIHGTDPRGRAVGIFARSREIAERIRDKVARGEQTEPADFEPAPTPKPGPTPPPKETAPRAKKGTKANPEELEAAFQQGRREAIEEGSRAGGAGRNWEIQYGLQALNGVKQALIASKLPVEDALLRSRRGLAAEDLRHDAFSLEASQRFRQALDRPEMIERGRAPHTLAETAKLLDAHLAAAEPRQFGDVAKAELPERFRPESWEHETRYAEKVPKPQDLRDQMGVMDPVGKTLDRLKRAAERARRDADIVEHLAGQRDLPGAAHARKIATDLDTQREYLRLQAEAAIDKAEEHYANARKGSAAALDPDITTAKLSTKDWDGSVVEGNKWVSDGHMMFRREDVDKLPEKKAAYYTEPHAVRKAPETAGDQVWAGAVKGADTPLELLGHIPRPADAPKPGKGGHLVKAYLSVKGKNTGYRAVQAALLRRLYEVTHYDELRGSERGVDKPIVAYRDGEPVGVLMPVRLGEEGLPFSIEEAREQLKKRPPPPKPKHRPPPRPKPPPPPGDTAMPSRRSDKVDIAAERVFGTTDNPKAGGWITTGGDFLDFGEGQSFRTADHTDIWRAYDEAGVELPSDPGSNFAYLRDFNARGNVRWSMLRDGDAQLQWREPLTDAQMRTIRAAIARERSGRVYMDVVKHDGGTLDSVALEGHPTQGEVAEALDRLNAKLAEQHLDDEPHGQGDLLSPEKAERIHAAASKNLATGEVFAGRTHGESQFHLNEAARSTDVPTEDGFVTDRGRFVDRQEAAEIAKRGRQINPAAQDEANEYGDRTELASEWLKGNEDLYMPAAERPRPYTLEDLDHASEGDLRRYQRYEENLAQRELTERDAGGDPTAPAGQPSKSPDELLVLENELQAAERKLAETQSPRLKQILEAQVHNRTRQQEAYFREYLNAGREKELDETVRARFKDAKPGGARDQDERRKQRDDFERRMREEAERRREWRERQQREREQRDRTRGGEREQRDREHGQRRQERERERHDRERERGRGRQEPPPRPPKPPKPPPPPSMKANPDVPPPKGAGGRVRSLWRIGRQFAKALDARVYQGRGNFARRRALGFFELHSEAIRVVRGDWLDVIAHEVGHFVSKLHLGHPTNRGAFARGAIPLTPEMMSELRRMGKNLYGSRKATLGYPEEGIAEWARMYVTDPAEATKQAPKFDEFMVNTVFKDAAHNGPAIAAAFDAAREHYARYEHATPVERIKASIDTHPSRFPGVAGLVRKAVTQWLDDLEEFRRFDEAAGNMKDREPLDSKTSVYHLARLARGAPARAEGWLKYGMVDVRTGRVVGRSVVDALTKVGEKNLDDFRAYLVAKSAVERWESGVNPGIRLNDARDVVRELEPRFKAQAEVIWDHYRQLLEARVHAGLLTPRAYQAILARNKTHVGFYRVFEDFEKPATGSRRGGGPGLRGGEGLPGQKGSGRDIIDPIESIMQDTYRTAAAIARHDALTALVKVANTVEGLGGVVTRVPAPIEVTKIYAPSVLEQLRALGLVTIDPITGEPRRLVKDDLLGEVLTAFSERERPGKTELKDLVIPFRQGDKTTWYQIGDRKLYDAVEGLDPAELAGALRFLSAPVRTFRAGVTLTGRFIVKNLFRDAGTAFIRSRSTRPVLPYEHFITGAFHWLKHGELVQRWRESGGDNATMLGLDRPTVSHNMRRLIRQNAGPKGLAFDIIRHPVDAIRSLSSIGENVTRLGEYAIVERQALKKGMGPAEAQSRAGFAARDVTQDFWMAGKSGRAVNQIVAFFNAQLNSVANLGRDLRNRPEVVLPRLAVGIAMPSVALYLLQRNDPEYKRIPRWQRDLGWIYLQRGLDRSAGWDGYGSGKVDHRWFIPKPFELGVLFGSTFERIAEWIVGHNPKDAWDQFDKSVDQAMTPGFLPHVISVWHELKSNHDDFRDRPIVPRGLEDVDARYQSRSTTGETARVLGDAFPGQGVSPAKIEHGIGGLFGGLGTAGLGVADAGVRATRKALKLPPVRPDATVLRPDPDEDPLTQAPGIGALVIRDPKEQAETIAKVYREFDAAERHRKTWMQLLKQGRTAQARDYFEKYKPAILSVATTEETGDQAGSLRQKYQAVTKLQEAGRQVPTARQRLLDALHSITEKGAGR